MILICSRKISVSERRWRWSSPSFSRFVSLKRFVKGFRLLLILRREKRERERYGTGPQVHLGNLVHF